MSIQKIHIVNILIKILLLQNSVYANCNFKIYTQIGYRLPVSECYQKLGASLLEFKG